jgi:hypothetical protein
MNNNINHNNPPSFQAGNVPPSSSSHSVPPPVLPLPPAQTASITNIQANALVGHKRPAGSAPSSQPPLKISHNVSLLQGGSTSGPVPMQIMNGSSSSMSSRIQGGYRLPTHFPPQAAPSNTGGPPNRSFPSSLTPINQGGGSSSSQQNTGADNIKYIGLQYLPSSMFEQIIRNFFHHTIKTNDYKNSVFSLSVVLLLAGTTALAEDQKEINIQIRVIVRSFNHPINSTVKRVFEDSFNTFIDYFENNIESQHTKECFPKKLSEFLQIFTYNKNKQNSINELVNGLPDVSSTLSIRDWATNIMNYLQLSTFVHELFISLHNKTHKNHTIHSNLLRRNLGIPVKPFEPSPEEIERTSKLDRWLSEHQNGTPYLWHPEHYLTKQEIIGEILPLFHGESNIDLIVKLNELKNKIGSGKKIADYSSTLLLFQLRCMNDNTPVEIEAITRLIHTLVNKMDSYHRSEFIRYIELIDTTEATGLRDELYDNFFRWADWSYEVNFSFEDDISGKKQWLSTQQVYRRIISLANEIKRVGREGMGFSRFSNAPDILALLENEEMFHLAFEAVIDRCEQKLSELENGEEVHTPNFYHGMKTGNQGVIPKNVLDLTGKICERRDEDAPAFRGAFIGTSAVPEYFPPGISWPTYILYSLPSNKILNLSYERLRTKHKSEYWIGVCRAIPISIRPLEGQEKRTMAINSIASSNLREQAAVLREAQVGEEVERLGPIQAMIFQYLKELATPNHLPVHWPHHVTIQAQDEVSFNCYPGSQNPIHESFMQYYLYQVQHTGSDDNQFKPPLFKKWPQGTHQGLLAILEKAHLQDHSRQNIMQGALTPGAPERALREGKDEELNQRAKQKQSERSQLFQEVKELFPEVSPPPAFRHIWRDISSDEVFGTVIGNNPFLLVNSFYIQYMLFDKGFNIRLESISNKESLFEDHWSMGDSLDTFFIRLAHSLIVDAIPSRSDDIIFVPYNSYRHEKAYIPLDPDVFDQGEAHGRDYRLHPNEPAFIYQMFEQLSDHEKTLLREAVYTCSKYKEDTTSHQKVNALFTLLQELGEAVQKRYFGSTKNGRDSLPERISNDALVSILNYSPLSIPEDSEDTPSDLQEKLALHSREADMIIKETQLHHPREEGVQYSKPVVNTGFMWQVFNTETRTKKTQKMIWKSLEDLSHLNFISAEKSMRHIFGPHSSLLGKSPEQITETLNNTYLAETTENIAYLAKLRETFLDKPNVLEAIDDKIDQAMFDPAPHEEGKLIRLCNTLIYEADSEIRRYLIEKLSSHQDRNRPFIPIEDYLQKALDKASAFLGSDSSDDKAYGEWMEHIEVRMQKIRDREEVMLGEYVYNKHQQPNDSQYSLTCDHESIEIGSVVFSSIFGVFKGDDDSSGSSEHQSITLEKDMYGSLGSIAHHFPKYEDGRVCAAFVVGTYSDPYAKVPVMTQEVAKLEMLFIQQYRVTTP